MKKQFQTLSIVGAIIFFSCGRHNAEITGAIPAVMKELSTNSSSIGNETELFLIDIEGQLRFNGDLANRAIELPYRPFARSASYPNDRSGGRKAIIQLNESLAVN